MEASEPVDAWTPPWSSFAHFFLSRTDTESTWLIELPGEDQSRREWTVTQWQEQVVAAARWLEANGLGPTDRIATIAGNSASVLAVGYSAWLLGACWVPLNPSDENGRIADVIRDSSTKLLVYAPEFTDRATDIADSLKISTLPIDAMAEPPLHRETLGAPPTKMPAGNLDSEALQIYTSGTTGTAKSVVLTVRNLLQDCDALLHGLNWSRQTRILTVLPMHHVNALVISCTLPWLARLSTVISSRFDVNTFWPDVEATGATVCSVVPTILELLLDASSPAPEGFQEFLCGGGPLRSETALRVENEIGVSLRHLYGLSETTAVATLMPKLTKQNRIALYGRHDYPSVGTPLPHAELKVEALDGKTLASGEEGEICVRGAIVMKEYAHNEKVTREALREGWFHTGDLGFWEPGPDGRRYYYISGRIKELIIRGGSNITPLGIDSVLAGHPAVKFALAVPFANRYYGEEIAAYVVPNYAVSSDDILRHCRSRLGHARSPKVIIFGNDLPFTATGKPRRIQLKRDLADTLAAYFDTRFLPHTITNP